jgi:hypothetical protein
MKLEVEAASTFLHQYLASHPRSKEIKKALSKALSKKFKGHWDEAKPIKGNGYRAINFIKGMPLDDILTSISKTFRIKDMQLLFPEELVLWCDPKCVSYRVGDYGYAIVVYETEKADSGTEVRDVSDKVTSKKIVFTSPKISFSAPKAEEVNYKSTVYAN